MRFTPSTFIVLTLMYCAIALLPKKVACAPLTLSGDTLQAKHSFHDGPLTEQVDSIVVVKRYRHMYVFNNKKLLKVYKICLGTSPTGHKHFQGDRKTPEGLYHINDKNAYSMAHKSLGISYPNEDDRKYARKAGKPTGGDVKIHGTLNGEEASEEEWAKSDWTWGCIAIRNKEIDRSEEHTSELQSQR